MAAPEKLISEISDKNLFEDIHFKIGKRLHISPYFNFKKYFENIDKASVVADSLSKAILECKDIPKNNYTLISYNAYSNFFISKTANLINEVRKKEFLDSGKKEKNYRSVNYAIANLEQSGEGLSFQFEPEFRSQLIIVIPVGSTFSIYLKLKDELQKWQEKMREKEEENEDNRQKKKYENIAPVSSISFTVFLITEKNGDSVLNKYRSIDSGKVVLNHNHTPAYTSYFLEARPCEIYSDADCSLCHTQDIIAEKYLFPVGKGTDAPKLIMNAPVYKNVSGGNPQQNHKHDFLKVFTVKNQVSPHVFGHLAVGYSNHLHYIKTDIFYENNKDEILNYFNTSIREKIDAYPEVVTSIVIFTTNRERYSPILEDLINGGIFKDYEVSVISCRPFREHTENFSMYKDELTAKGKYLIFYTDMLWGGLQFKELDYILSQYEGRNLNFNLLMTLVDRTNASNKARICYRHTMTDENIISFFKLNVSQITSTHLGNPIAERHKKLIEIFESTHLDALKIRLLNQLRHCENKSIEELDNPKTKWYNPLHKFSFTRKHWNLLKLYVYHTINENLAMGDSIEDILKPEKVSEIARRFFTAHPEIVKVYDNKKDMADKIVKDSFVKILSRSPFSDYWSIYDTMFYYNLRCLQDIINEINRLKDIDYELYRSLKFHIRRTVELDSNAVISEEFIGMLKNNFAEKLRKAAQRELKNKQIGWEYRFKDFSNFKYYLLYCVKELIANDPGRSVSFEGLINSEGYLPEPVINDKMPLQTAIQDGFYNYGRLLKMENIPLLRNFRNYLQEEMKNDMRNIEALRDEIYKQYFGNQFFKDIPEAPVNYEHEMTIALLNRSRFKDMPGGFTDIRMSTARMLAIQLYIRQHEAENDKAEKKQGEPIDLVLKNILEHIQYIFEPYTTHLVKSGLLNYGLFIEYQNKNGEKRIYPVLSESNKFDHENPDPQGLIYKMLDGILDSDHGSIQTMLPLVRGKDDVIISFQPDNNFFERQPDGQNSKINIAEAFQKDREHFSFLNDATMLQYFRLAEVVNDTKDEHPDKGRAVLVICSKEPNPQTSNFVRFLNVEKVRLLLLLRTELLSYLKHNIANDVFMELINDKENHLIKDSLTHGIERYLDVIRGITEKSEGKSDRIMGTIATSAISGQVNSIAKLKLDLKTIRDKKINGKPANAETFKEMIETICNNTILGNKVTVKELDVDDFPIAINEMVYDIILPELIVNMNRYHPSPGGEELFKITVKDNVFTFTNNARNEMPKKIIRKNKGLYMCSMILEELKLNGITPYPGNGIFKLELNLNKKK